MSVEEIRLRSRMFNARHSTPYPGISHLKDGCFVCYYKGAYLGHFTELERAIEALIKAAETDGNTVLANFVRGVPVPKLARPEGA